MSLLMAGGLEPDDLSCPFQPKPFYDSTKPSAHHASGDSSRSPSLAKGKAEDAGVGEAVAAGNRAWAVIRCHIFRGTFPLSRGSLEAPPAFAVWVSGSSPSSAPSPQAPRQSQQLPGSTRLHLICCADSTSHPAAWQQAGPSAAGTSDTALAPQGPLQHGPDSIT